MAQESDLVCGGLVAMSLSSCGGRSWCGPLEEDRTCCSGGSWGALWVLSSPANDVGSLLPHCPTAPNLLPSPLITYYLSISRLCCCNHYKIALLQGLYCIVPSFGKMGHDAWLEKEGKIVISLQLDVYLKIGVGSPACCGRKALLVGVRRGGTGKPSSLALQSRALS